jgi:16S rRNA (guanine527-N7)-methyltransferase
MIPDCARGTPSPTLTVVIPTRGAGLLRPDHTAFGCEYDGSVDTASIARLLVPFLETPLPEHALQQILTYINLLQRWNVRVNLTAIRDEEEIVTRHFGESLFLARHLFPLSTDASSKPEARSSKLDVIDIGSGAGFPGLPLKIWSPEIHLALIESNHKKAAFLKEVSRELTLTNINVITARAETVKATADVVTLRAVEHFDSILPIAEKVVAPKGRLALLIGSSQQADLPKSMIWSEALPIPQSSARVLAIGVR